MSSYETRTAHVRPLVHEHCRCNGQTMAVLDQGGCFAALRGAASTQVMPMIGPVTRMAPSPVTTCHQPGTTPWTATKAALQLYNVTSSMTACTAAAYEHTRHEQTCHIAPS